MKTALSHVDLRVRDRVKATAFYDAILVPFGYARVDGETFTTYEVSAEDDSTTWLGFIVDAAMHPGSARVALAAATRGEVDHAAELAHAAGAARIEGPEYAYGPDYYAVFFEDPDGNKLEFCCYGPPARRDANRVKRRPGGR